MENPLHLIRSPSSTRRIGCPSRSGGARDGSALTAAAVSMQAVHSAAAAPTSVQSAPGAGGVAASAACARGVAAFAVGARGVEAYMPLSAASARGVAASMPQSAGVVATDVQVKFSRCHAFEGSPLLL